MVQWKCPGCRRQASSEMVDGYEQLVCDGCRAELRISDLVCVVCDSVSSLRRRDSVHFWCISCGHTQTRWMAATGIGA